MNNNTNNNQSGCLNFNLSKLHIHSLTLCLCTHQSEYLIDAILASHSGGDSEYDHKVKNHLYFEFYSHYNEIGIIWTIPYGLIARTTPLMCIKFCDFKIFTYMYVTSVLVSSIMRVFNLTNLEMNIMRFVHLHTWTDYCHK